MSDSSTESGMVYGYDVAHEYLGDRVKVYLFNGSILVGTVVRTRGKFIKVDSGKRHDAIINLDHVASITRR